MQGLDAALVGMCLDFLTAEGSQHKAKLRLVLGCACYLEGEEKRLEGLAFKCRTLAIEELRRL